MPKRPARSRSRPAVSLRQYADAVRSADTAERQAVRARTRSVLRGYADAVARADFQFRSARHDLYRALLPEYRAAYETFHPIGDLLTLSQYVALFDRAMRESWAHALFTRRYGARPRGPDSWLQLLDMCGIRTRRPYAPATLIRLVAALRRIHASDGISE